MMKRIALVLVVTFGLAANGIAAERASATGVGDLAGALQNAITQVRPAAEQAIASVANLLQQLVAGFQPIIATAVQQIAGILNNATANGGGGGGLSSGGGIFSNLPIPIPIPVGGSKKIKDVTGPGHTDRFGMAATDLGAMTRTPDGRIIAVFGDTFTAARVGGGDWRSPVALYSLTKPEELDGGINWTAAAGQNPGRAMQLIPYQHDNAEFSTVLPSDILTVDQDMYLHLIYNKGLGNVVRTEIWKSSDNGRSWQDTGAKFPADLHGGLAQMWTWDVGPDGKVYILSSGFIKRDKPAILRRVDKNRIADPAAYEAWDGRSWGREAKPILPGQLGEMCLRYMKDRWVLVNFNSGAYRIDMRAFTDPTAVGQAPVTTPIRGGTWGMENDSSVAQLYGGYIVPGSDPDGDFHIFVSQWNTTREDGWPYRVMQFKVAPPRM